MSLYTYIFNYKLKSICVETKEVFKYKDWNIYKDYVCIINKWVIKKNVRLTREGTQVGFNVLRIITYSKLD